MRLTSLVLMLALPASLPAADEFLLEETRLQLRAEARACYLGLFQMYDADYLVSRDGDASARCVRLSYLRRISTERLRQGTNQVFEARHGEAVAQRYRVELEQVAAAYRPVAPGDRYTYCVAPDTSGLLLRNEQPVLRLPSADFARRFMQIWVTSEDGTGQPQWGFGSC